MTVFVFQGSSVGPEASVCQARNPNAGFLATRLFSRVRMLCCRAIPLPRPLQMLPQGLLNR